MIIDNPTGDPNCHRPQYRVAFEARRIEDLPFDEPPASFDRARQLSEATDQAYGLFVSPWVRAMSNPATAALLKWLHPMRSSRYLLSEKFAPWMYGVAALVNLVRSEDAGMPTDSPWRAMEQALIEQTTATIRIVRQLRNISFEFGFRVLYGDLPSLGQSGDSFWQQATPGQPSPSS